MVTKLIYGNHITTYMSSNSDVHLEFIQCCMSVILQQTWKKRINIVNINSDPLMLSF